MRKVPVLDDASVSRLCIQLLDRLRINLALCTEYDEVLFAKKAFPKVRDDFKYLDAVNYGEPKVEGDKAHVGSVISIQHALKKQEYKLNYELNIGARKFKCTTIPIYRPEFGIVGAICINIDVNYLTDEVMSSQERIEAFFKNFCRID